MVQLEYYLKLHSNINPCKETINFQALEKQVTVKKLRATKKCWIVDEEGQRRWGVIIQTKFLFKLFVSQWVQLQNRYYKTNYFCNIK